MGIAEDSKKIAYGYGGDYVVVCFDCQTPHEMRFPDGLQAEAFAALMTRHEKPCPVCGGTAWSSIGDIGDVLDGTRARVFEAVK